MNFVIVIVKNINLKVKVMSKNKNNQEEEVTFEVKSYFKTTKKEYKKGDKISLSSEKQIKYLQSINVI